MLDLLADAFDFVDAATFDDLVRRLDPFMAWEVANMYLSSVGAALLGPDEPRAVGVSANCRCYVLTHSYFENTDPFADFVVHEAAHALHDVRRATLGWPESPGRERLVNV